MHYKDNEVFSMSILVTGALGFIGSHTCRRLADEGERVIAYYRTPRKIDFLGDVSERIREVRGDVTDLAHLMYTIRREGVTGVIHAAAVVTEPPSRARPYAAFQVNVTGTANVLEAARIMDLERVVFLSSGAAAGPTEDLSPVKEDQRSPDGIYGTTKLMSELLGLRYHAIYGLDFIVVRPTWIYGPGRDALRTFGKVVPWDLACIFENVVEDKPVELGEGGDHPFDFTYVKDVVEVIVSAYEKRNPRYRVFNASVGRLYTLGEAAEAFKAVKPEARIEIGPGLIGDIYVRGPLDITRAREDLGFEPRYDLEGGIREWLAWSKGGKIY
ncbi:MAG: NAD-dependent epimerase/dehydratase family protein [Candidatus Geothermarchaeales archaeon]